jgi:hypothetical protein
VDVGRQVGLEGFPLGRLDRRLARDDATTAPSFVEGPYSATTRSMNSASTE